jgi:hypothetical protein
MAKSKALLDKLGVNDDMITRWVEQLHYFLSGKIKDFVRDFDENTAEMVGKKINIDFLNRKTKYYTINMADGTCHKMEMSMFQNIAYQENHPLFPHFFSTKTRRSGLTRDSHLPSLHLIRERVQLERYLRAGSDGNELYVLERLRQLSVHRYLSSLRWDAGDEKSWNSSKPSDAKILMYFYLAYMDILLPVQHLGQNPFTDNHFLELDESREMRGRLLIVFKKANPPHFEIWNGQELWNVAPGRNNIFHSIVLMLYAVKKTKQGHLAGIDLTPSIIDYILTDDYME